MTDTNLLERYKIVVDDLQHRKASARANRSRTEGTNQIEEPQQNRQDFSLLLLREDERVVDGLKCLEDGQETVRGEEMRFDFRRFFEDLQLFERTESARAEWESKKRTDQMQRRVPQQLLIDHKIHLPTTTSSLRTIPSRSSSTREARNDIKKLRHSQ